MRTWNFTTCLTALCIAACTSSAASPEAPSERDAGGDAEPAPEAPYDEVEQAPLSLIDVSVLFPLGAAAAPQLWPADVATERGALLPAALALPRIALPTDFASAAEEYAALRVVAVRLDPCFREAPSTECHSQVRLVLQPLDPNADDGRMLDAGLHVFFSAPEPRVRALAETLRAARIASQVTVERARLTVHPVLEHEQLRGSFSDTLRREVLAVLGSAELTRITALALRDRVNTWSFSAFAVADGTLTPMALPHVTTSQEQRLTSNGMGGLMQMTLTPDSAAADSLQAVYDVGVDVPAELGGRMLGRARRIENPLRHDQGTIDCVNCHVAAGVRRFLELRSMQSADTPFRSELAFELDDSAFEDTGRVHVFSYRGRVPLIAPRVVYESVQTLERWR